MNEDKTTTWQWRQGYDYATAKYKAEIDRLKDENARLRLVFKMIEDALVDVPPKDIDECYRLRAQLPEGMEHCTIKFIECPKGHGRLTATNWVQHECDRCEIDRLRAENEELRHLFDILLNDQTAWYRKARELLARTAKEGD